MTTDPDATRISARQRLAQTRAEIIGAILPQSADGYSYEEPPRGSSRAWSAAAAAEQRAAAAATTAAAQRRAAQQTQREAVADWVAADAAAAASDAPQSAAGRDAHARAAASSARGGRRPAPSSFGWVPLLRHGASIWWRHHPAHAAVEVVDSALSHIAYRRPYQMLGVAAGVGALLVLVRPWRMVSITGLALAAVRMTDMRSVLSALRDG